MKPSNKNRSQAYVRHQRNRVIQKKRSIAKHTGWHYRFEGSLNKGKVHCSCGLCAQKTKKHGFPHSERVQLERLNSQLADFMNGSLE